ncbi:hypothetical protein [Chitinophaga cymbidii]|uniref:hypothetical protein n=1 Tax=Chitinophaga cymbidii TaxID=1096750 RepID=UPI0011BE1C46|nr:hypothetical protein [Chitinophaga cymbidii]
MKYLLFLIASLLWTGIALGQTASNTESHDSSNIYYQAFMHYCSNSLPDNNGILLVEENNITTESLPKQLKNIRVEVVDVQKLQKKLKTTKSLTLIRVVPLRVKEGRFFVNIIPFDVSRTRSGFHYVNSGGCTVEFLYDCTNDVFSLSAVVNKGI